MVSRDLPNSAIVGTVNYSPPERFFPSSCTNIPLSSGYKLFAAQNLFHTLTSIMDIPCYFKGDPLYLSTFSLLQSQREKLLHLILMHKNIRALDYPESQTVNHKEDFQCPAVKCSS